MYNPHELQRKAQLNLHGVDTNAQTSLNNNNPPKQESEQNWFVRGLATIGNIANNIVMGAVKSIEGIVDTGAMLVGLFGADVDDFVSYDFTADIFGTDEEGEGLLEWSWGRNLSDVSYLDNENIVNQIAEGVGGLLPTVAIGILTGGTSLAGTAASAGAKAATIGAKIAQTGTFVASAMGNASESALQDGADYNQALGYGALSGVTEGVIESISGGIGGTKMGTVLGKQIAKKTGTKLATTFISEGLEEVASDLIDPVYQRITGVNEEAKIDTNNLFRTFVVGGSIGAIMGGVGRKLKAHQNADKGGEKFLKVADEVSEIEDAITEKENTLSSEKKTQEDVDNVGVKVVDKIINSVKTISDHLQSMSESQRSNALNIINEEESIVSNLFEDNGEIKSGVLEDLELSKKRHYSANSILKSQQINEELSNLNQEKGWNLEVDDSQINENERAKLAQFYAVKNGLSEKTGKNLNFVIVKGPGAEAIDGFYSKNGKTIYISRETLSDSLKEISPNALYQTTVHETEHFVDNAPLQKYLINYAQKDETLFSETVSELMKKGYGITRLDVENAIRKRTIGLDLSDQEEIAYSELSANLAAKLLGDEDFIKRLARTNRGLFNKIKNFISDKINRGKKSEAYRTAQHIFENALKEIKEKDTFAKEEFDNSDEIRYSFRSKRTARYINKKLDTPTLSFIKKELKNIYSAVDSGVADSLPIEMNNQVFIVDSGLEDGKIDFGVKSVKTITDNDLRKEYIRRKNDEAIQKGHISYELSSRFGDEYVNSWNSYRRLKFGKELSTNNGESTNNERKFSKGNGNDGRGRLNFSLKDYEKSLNIKVAGLKAINIKDESENRKLKREIEDRNGNHPYRIDWALTDKFLYIVKDNTGESFTPIVKIDCEKYYDFVLRLFRKIDRNNYNVTKTLDDWMTEVINHPDSIAFFNPDPLFTDYQNITVQDEIATTIDEGIGDANFKDIDSLGRKLSEQQIEYFKDSKVRDRYGRLKEVYHGTYGEFYTFDKSLLGTNVNSPDAKLGFFFTASKRLAEDYSSQAKRHKMFNLMYKLANDDVEVLKFLTDKSNFYDNKKIEKIIETEEYSEIQKIKELEESKNHDVFSVYLDIKKPYIEDWKKKMHYSTDMVRAITKALTNGYDGVIIKSVNASITEYRPANDLYIVFEPNQIKAVSNKAPTKNPDIRFSLKEYSDVQKKNWENSKKIIIYENETQFKNIINESLDNNQYDKKIYFGAIDSNLGKYIFEKTGLNLENYNCSLQTNEIRKIIKSHSNDESERKHGQRAITSEDILNIPNVIQNPTDIIRSDKDYDGKPVIHFVKQISNEKTTVVAVVSDKHLDLRVQTEYVGIKKRNLATPINEQAFIHTPEATRGTVSNNSIRNSEENVNTNSENFSNQIKFSKKDNATYTLSDGQVKKKVANFTKLKVYSKVEAERVINSILDSNLGFEEHDISISGKTKEEAIDVLWKTLNTAESGKRIGVSLRIADYILDNAVMENIYQEDENVIYLDTIKYLKPYLHNINLNGIKDEIKYRYDNDNSVYLLWGKRKGENGQSADQIAMELAESGFFIDAENEADIFFEMDRAYRDAVKALKGKKEKLLSETISKEERDKLRQDIAKDILRAFDSNGKKSKLAEIIEQQKQRAKVWKDLYYEEKARNEAIDNLLGKVGTLKGLKEFENSTQYSSEQFKGSIEKLEKLKWRGKLNESGARKIVGVLNAWYNKDNAIVGAKFDSEVSEDLNRIASGNGKLTSTEINSLVNVVDYFIHFIEHNRQVWENERWIEQGPLAKEYYEKALENAKIKIGAISRLMDSKYMETFADPMSIARNADRYSDGFFTKTMEDLRNGAVDSEIKAMKIASPIVDFLDKNKKYLKRVNKTTITYRGVKIPIIKVIDLYCELNRNQAILGFVKSGIKLTDVKGKKTITIGGIESNDELSFDEYKAIAQKEQAEIGKLLNDTDYEFIGILEKIYNEDCKDLKKERDKQLRGYTNIDDNGYYYPTSRADTRKSINVDFFGGDRVGNESFNKSIVKGAQQTLWIESALDRVLRHIEGVSRYYYLSNPIQNFEVLYNLDLGGNPNAPKSIKTATENTWRNGSEYLRKLMQDIQGIKNGDGSYLFGFLRKGFAKFQLGFNPKVLLSQFSSLFASWNILDYESIVKGFAIKVKTDDIDKYCSLAKLRNNDNAAVKSMGVLDNVDSFTDKFTVLIGKMDRGVIRILFGACQVQVQKNNGLKIGTEENKIKAGELLRKVILETQQNAIATERSEAMRSSSEFLKGTTMFTADIMKVTARVIDSFGEISTIKARLKIENDPVKRKKLMDSLKLAHKKARKSVTAMVVQAVYMAILARLFDKFYNRDEEDEEVVTDLVVDFFGNMIGGLPLIKDLYSKVFEGYDFDSFAFSSMNDLFEAVGSVDGLWSGDSRQVAKTIRKISYAVGQIFGVPVRNLYNVFYGTSNLISPEFAYKIDDIFYKQSYNSDLKKAIKNNDEAMIATIAGLIMNENVGDFENGSTRSEVNRLLSAGFDVLPQSVPNSVTINEVQHSLTGPQQEKFRKAYSGAITAVDKLVSSNGYKIATDEAKAKAIKYVYRYYYYEAQHQALNVDLDSKLYLFGQIVPIEKMALALAEVPLLVENSTNKKTAVQRYLQASKLTSAQKYMLMGYFGYKNTKGEGVVKNAINKTSLTKEQKKLLLEKCGY